MKKTNKLFFTMCMVGGFAVLFGSCKKNDETASVAINLPAFEEEVDGRAYIDINNGNSFKWNANDQVVFYNLDNQNGNNSEKAIYQTTANAQGQASATFSYASGDVLSAKKYGYFVFYPVEKVSANKLNELNYETFTVSDTQEYTKLGNASTVAPEGMAMACDLQRLGGSFSLKHIFGVLKLKIKGTGTVTSIDVIDERFNLSGTVGMKLHEVNMNTFSSLQNTFIANDDPENTPAFVNAWNEYRATLGYNVEEAGGKTMTLNVNNGVGLNTSTEQIFCIGLRPGALKYGFTVIVHRNGMADYVLDYTGNNNLHYGIKAGIIKNLAVTIN